MRLPKLFIVLLLGLLLVSTVDGQTPKSATKGSGAVGNKEPSKRDLSKEGYVIEKLSSRLRYEADGTGSKSSYSRIRVQSEAGVQQAGLIRFGYNTAFENIVIEYVRVTKPDGRQITASTDSIQDLAAEIQRIAPQYSDFREKHVTVPSLRPGDLLEYSVITTIHNPVIPGQFFDAYSFARQAIVVNEEVDLDVPADRKLTTKFAAGFTPDVRTEGPRRYYHWSHANDGTETAEDETGSEDVKEVPPEIQISTFADWGEVAKWYAGLQFPRAEPNEAIRKKAGELVAGASSEKEKIQAIYSYVATNIRYLGLSFGIGRFQPHSAVDVLANQYGDCKDKHTLLAALLAAAGVKAEPVLISAERKLDEAVPSPAQFDHLITAIRSGDSYIYADTTTEAAALGYLVPPLRGKLALRIDGSGGANLVTTPAQPAEISFESMDVKAQIKDSGDLDAEVTLSAKGDAELVWRVLLRRTPESQWNQMLKATLGSLDGEVSNVTSANVSELSKPFELKFHVAKKKYYTGSGDQEKLALPMGIMLLRPAATPEQKKGPIRLYKQEIVRHVRLEVPKDIMVLPPRASKSSKDFVEYSSTYAVEKNVLKAERVYKVTQDEVPRARYADYNEVYDVANSDQEQTAYFVPAGGMTVKLSRAKPATSSATTNRSADELVSDFRIASRNGDLNKSQSLLEKAVEKDPKHPEAWWLLGGVYMRRGSIEKSYVAKGIEAFRKHVEMDPKSEEGWQALGAAYLMTGNYSGAAEAFAKLHELSPYQPGVNNMLGDALLKAGRAKEAIAPLEEAVASHSEVGYSRIQLARAYYLSGQAEKGSQITESLISGDVEPMQRARVADMLADVNESPDIAEQQVQIALSEVYGALQQVPDLKEAEESDLDRTWKLAAVWQSAGWVYYQHGDLARAERYLESAWMWSMQFNAGDRLAQVYMKQGKKQEAVRVWAQALATASVEHPEARSHFVEAVGDAKRADLLVSQHRLDLQEMRTLQVPNPNKIAGFGQFFVSVGTGSKIEAAVRHNGDENVARLSERLEKTRLELPFPDEQPIHVLRIGILSCYGSSSSCMFVLIPQPSFTMMGPGF